MRRGRGTGGAWARSSSGVGMVKALTRYMTVTLDARIWVRGKLNGDVVAHEVVTLEAGSVVTGNIRAPRIIIEEGARFKGNIDMDVQAG